MYFSMYSWIYGFSDLNVYTSILMRRPFSHTFIHTFINSFMHSCFHTNPLRPNDFAYTLPSYVLQSGRGSQDDKK